MAADGKNSPRSTFLLTVLLVALAALCGRLIYFQITSGERMSQLSFKQGLRRHSIAARRGNIYAANATGYQLLASSKQVPSVFIDPFLIEDEDIDEVAERVGSVLDMDPDKIRKIIHERRARRYASVKQDISQSELENLYALKIRAVGIEYLWRRRYPNGPLASHVVGYTGADQNGLEGLELAMDPQLSSTDGKNYTITDSARHPIWNRNQKYSRPLDGMHIYLSIDTFIQHEVESVLAETVEKFGAESAIGMVVEPQSGRILAMANFPTYDPAAFRWSEAASRRNRCLTDIYEPGSIFKCFVASAALNESIVNWGDVFFCHDGEYRCRPGRVLHDAHPFGKLSVEQIVYKSSNIGMALIGEKMGAKKMCASLKNFGFGSLTGIRLPGERSGILRDADKWTKDSIWSIPMGHEVSVTPMQVMMAFSAIANGGNLLEPILIDRMLSPTTNESYVSEPKIIRRVLRADVAKRFVRDALAQTPIKGTSARRGNLDGWSSFGKTGTAQIPPFSKRAYIGSYIAGAPVENPRLVCLISIKRPDISKGYYGGTVAAPAVKKVLESSLAYLGVEKDLED